MSTNKGESIAVHKFPDKECKYKPHNVNWNLYYIKDKYKVCSSLLGSAPQGIGHFWTFYNKKDDENVTILKIEAPFRNLHSTRVVLREIMQLRHMNHPNIIALKDVISPAPGLQEVYMAYESMNCDLHSLIHSGRRFSDYYCMKMLYQILCGLKYAQSANIIRFNLNTMNILVTADNVLKISDFGITELHGQNNVKRKQMVLAPELLVHPPVEDMANHVWAAGVVFMQLMYGGKIIPEAELRDHLLIIVQLLGTPPEEELGFLDEITKKVIREYPIFSPIPFVQKFPNLDPLAMDLAQKMFVFNPQKRIKIDEALDHPYLQRVRCKENEIMGTTFNYFVKEGRHLSLQQAREKIHQVSNEFNH